MRFGASRAAHVGVAIWLIGIAGSVQAADGDRPPAFRRADTSSPRSTLKSFIDACNELGRQIKSQKFFDRYFTRASSSRTGRFSTASMQTIFPNTLAISWPPKRRSA